MADWKNFGTPEWDEEPVDPEIIPLCEALNQAGFTTFASCSGHGYQWPCIWFEHSSDERIESMARFVLQYVNHDYPPYSCRIRKQIHHNIGDYSWSIEIQPSGVSGDTPPDISLRRVSDSVDSIVYLIKVWHEIEQDTKNGITETTKK
jgi:hypothetical protein